MDFNPIHLAYGVMIVGIILCFVLSKNVTKDMRGVCDDFAMAFVKLSNYISPKDLTKGPACEISEDGTVKILPMDKQSETIQGIFKRANEDESVELFQQLVSAYDEIEKRAGINRTRKAQFAQPMNELLFITHAFLTGCENPDSIDTQEKLDKFNSFLTKQLDHRMVLLKRISFKLEDDFREQNKVYQKDMEKAEKAEREARRKK